ncbi:MAG: dipeptide ABC transporter ATP-binding protein [Pseudomonadota bacterium]
MSPTQNHAPREREVMIQCRVDLGLPLLDIDNLHLQWGEAPCARLLSGVTLSVRAGERVALVGESGSGKSVTALSVLGLLDPDQARYTEGHVLFAGRNLLALGETALRGVRGRDIAMIFQEPMTALNPLQPIWKQIAEALVLHENLDWKAARARAIELLDLTGITEPARRADAFAHSLSGGQRQRVMIAMALACRPRLLIADEPTTALDVTLQAQIMQLLMRLQSEFGMALLLITHDLNLVRHFADRVYVMHEGRVVENGTVSAVFHNPSHPYTQHLMNSRPARLSQQTDVPPDAEAVLEGQGLRVDYLKRPAGLFRHAEHFRALDGVDFTLRAGETLGVVGESGSGKSTLAAALLRLLPADGVIRLCGEEIQALSQRALRPKRRELQMVFQDPFSALSPRLTIEKIVGEGLDVHEPGLSGAERHERIVRALVDVGLSEMVLGRYPHEFSGGQRQRIAIARALVLRPRVLILDEPTSALDVSVQKQVLELLYHLQRSHGLSYLLITHDLSVIRSIAHRVMVLYGGQVVEEGPVDELFNHPKQEYTRRLLGAALAYDGLPAEAAP